MHEPVGLEKLAISGEQELAKRLPGAWYDHYDGNKPLVFGHHDYLRNGQPLVREGRLYGIDTGCVYGGLLTALVLPAFSTVSVRARENYWARIRTEHEKKHAS